MIAPEMKVDWQAFKRARRARDARFDGKFFVASTNTRIYCRPSCNVPMIKDKYVRYFPNAAAATEAGYRPCLRCRPECSPGTPASMGTSSTVSRALRLIGETGLEDVGVKDLAERLGIGSRQVRRLFLRHLGATPRAVAHTRRLHFAKKLIDETALPMNQVAVAAGFGSVRRFNAAIQKTYNRTPSHIRRIARPAGATPENQYRFRLNFRPPYDWGSMLAFLAARATPGVEMVDRDIYRRSISLNGCDGYFEIALNEDSHALIARIQFADPCSLFAIIERIRAMFDLNADSSEIARCLARDPILAAQVKAAPGLRVPGCWNGFELAVRAILGQQITVKGATALAGRVVTMFGKAICAASDLTHLFPTANVLADADLRRAGLTAARAQTIRALARDVCSGQIKFDGIVDYEAFLGRLCEVPGIGPWTAQYVAMRALGEPDAFPSGDLGLLRAAGLGNSRELERRAETWRPWRAYAAMYLWNSLASRPTPKSKPLSFRKQDIQLQRTQRVGLAGAS